MIDFTLTDEHRLVQQSARAFVEAEILPHIREWDEKGEVHREVFDRMGALGLPRRADPRGVRRGRDGLHQLRAAVRGARAGRHRVPGRPERPRRAELADPPPVGDRGAAPALPRAPGARREAGDVRADRARASGPTPARSRRPPAATATATSSTARRSGSAWPTWPTTSSSSRRSTRRRSTRA